MSAATLMPAIPWQAWQATASPGVSAHSGEIFKAIPTATATTRTLRCNRFENGRRRFKEFAIMKRLALRKEAS